VLPSAGAIAWAVVDGADGLREAGRRVLCDAPRAVAMVGSRIAVACRDGLAVAGIGGDTPIERIPINGNPYDVVAGDLDGDGRTDLAAVDQANDSVVVTAGLAGDRWSRPIVHPVGGDPVALVAADLGGDGDLDLVVSAFETRTIDVLENLSSP